MPPLTAAAVAGAIGLDAAVGELPERVHPVALFGRIVGVFDRPWGHPRLVGGALALLLPLGGALFAAGTVVAVVRTTVLAGIAMAGVWVFSAVSLRMLLSLAAEAVRHIETDLPRARETMRGLVGRNTTSLGPAELRSAVVESLAENLSDGFVAPLCGFLIGAQFGLAGATAGAVWVKAVNTMDSMLGYPDKPVGWASARLDDVVMYLPARLTAGMLALAAGAPAAAWRARRWARMPASPNAGWPMATMAEALGITLTKSGAYTLNPDRGLPDAATTRRAIRVTGVAGLMWAVLAGVIAWH